MKKNLFREKIREKIANDALQIALDGNADRRTTARVNAFAGIPDHKERRQRAHAIRKDIVDHLDDYVQQFKKKVEENGIKVHLAENADEAMQIFMEIAGQHDAHLVAKSKSMVSEEINFNHVLEARGMKPVETDLGEYIVQLRGERPAHIITPAVHLRRHEVGALFHEKLGIPYTEEIPTLTNTARRILRDVFLEADIGLSGINFGVVDTGTLCIVTNEGNGRMVTTIPPVHVALMGMERLLPDMDALSLFLSLLPRSATAQKLTVYTNLINKPRDANENEGPQERHLILLDNGRRRMSKSSLKDSLMCIRCGACLNACPVFREIGGHGYLGTNGSMAPYPGPIGSVVSPGLFGIETFGQLAQASSLCGACKDACPVDIDLPKMLLQIRYGQIQETELKPGHPPEGTALGSPLKLGLSVYRFAATNQKIFSFAQWIGARLSRLVFPIAKWIHMPTWSGWGLSKDIPHPAASSFHKQWGSLEHEEIGSISKLEPISIPEDIGSPRPSMDLKEQFISELEALGGRCVPCKRNQVAEQLQSLISEKNIQRVLVDEFSRSLLESSDLELVRSSDPSCKVGISHAVAGLADTGSLILIGGPAESLSASLLPETHIAILHSRDLLPSLGDVINDEMIREASSAVIISGPSRTADIEMTLTIGVHGPGELIVLLVDD
ncbi:MAG TPA: LUD domain-containing protein [Anaerolineales bacterium]|nr:LUD domain-containing protein [Anaerolineales bacterium]